MKQNIYDDPQFFDKYAELPRSKEGLSAANEWPEVKNLLPKLPGLRVLDLGCGYGWHCRYLKENGASSVVGIDLSEKMLEQARAQNNLEGIEYRQAAIEDISFQKNEFDLVFSSLAFHYVEDFSSICKTVYQVLKPGGHFVFSMEHPVFTSNEMQDWIRNENGEVLHWPVDSYHSEGKRATKWLADNVIKYHHTFSSIMNALLNSGFKVTQVLEPTVSAETLKAHPEWSDENRRPMFLLVAAEKS